MILCSRVSCYLWAFSNEHELAFHHLIIIMETEGCWSALAVVQDLPVQSPALCFHWWQELKTASSTFWFTSGQHCGPNALYDLHQRWFCTQGSWCLLTTLSSSSASQVIMTSYSSRWTCQPWNLRLNADRCVAIDFTCSSQQLVSYTLRMLVLISQNHCDQGVTVRQNLSWSGHYNKIWLRAYGALHLIHRSISFDS